MDELIIRMSTQHRINLLKLREHRINEFNKALEKRILNYFNRLFERNKIPKAFKEAFEHEKNHREAIKEKLSYIKDSAQSIASKNSNTLISSAAFAATAVGKAAQQYQENNIAQHDLKEAREQLKAAQISIYFPEDRATIVKSVVNILSFHYQFLILRLSGGNNGYIKLANFMGDAIEAFSLDKLREHPNQINCLVDAAIPKSNSRRYFTFSPSLSKPWLHKTLEIDHDTNELINQCGPAVQSLLGAYKKHTYYTIRDVLNFPLIINGSGEIIKSATEKESRHQILNSETPYPVILIGPNETTTDLGLNHGSTPTTQTIASLQLSALQRLVPDFFAKEINHDTKIEIDNSDENPAEMVHIEERNEFKWTIERKKLWLSRQASIKSATNKLPLLNPASMAQDIHGITAKKKANIFDAEQAVIDVKKMLCEIENTLDELNGIRESDTHEETINNQKLMKEKLANKIYYLILSVKQLILSAQKLTSHDENKKNYFNLAIRALKNAKHNMEAIRETPINEFTAQKEHEQLTQRKKNLFTKWQDHLYFCNLALDITSYASAPLQLPQAIRKFVFDMDSKNSKAIDDLMNQATIQAAHTNLLMEQMATLNKYALYDLRTNRFPRQEKNNSNKRGLMNISQVSSYFLRDKLSIEDEEEKSSDTENEPTIQSHRNTSNRTSCVTLNQINLSSPNNKKSSLTLKKFNIGIELTSMKKDIQYENNNHLDNNQSIKVESEELLSKNDDAQQKEFIDMIKNAFHELTISKNDITENRIDKIKICTDGIRRFKNGIFSSLGIDEFDLEQNKSYVKDVEKTLSIEEHNIAQNTEDLFQQALANQKIALEKIKQATKKNPFSRKKKMARKIIKNCEATSTDQIQKIIDSQSLLEKAFLKDQSSSSRILWVFLRFQIIIMPALSLMKLNGSSNWQLNIEKINEVALKHENQVEQKNFRNMEIAYEKMTNQINAIPGDKPSCLNEALQYAQIIKNCNRKVIHSANGERTAAASSEKMINQLNSDIKKIIFDINNIKKVLLNLTRDCQTATDSSNNIKQGHVIVKTSEAIKEIQSFIAQLNNRPKSSESRSRLLRCESYLVQENSASDIKLQLLEKVNELIDHATKISPSKKNVLLAYVQQELLENSKHLNKNYGYLNWGVWLISIAARTCVLFHRNQLNLNDEIIEADPVLTINEKKDDNVESISQTMLSTRKLLLETYQQLDHVMHTPQKDIEETLTTPKELVMDELQWASQLNIDEIQARDHQKSKENKTKQNKTQSEIPTKNTYQTLIKSTKEKPNPIKSIYYQLLIYSILSVRNKQNIIQKLNNYRSQLRKDNHYFKNIVENKELYVDVIQDIQNLYKSIESKVILEQKEKNNINHLEKNLTSRRVILQIFFQDWKDKTRDLFPTNSLLSALKEASKIRRKNQQRKIEQKKQTVDEKEEEQSLTILSSTIESLSLENIDELFLKIQQRIKQAKESISPLPSMSNLDSSSNKSSDSDSESTHAFSLSSSNIAAHLKMDKNKTAPQKTQKTPLQYQLKHRFFKTKTQPKIKINHQLKSKVASRSEEQNQQNLAEYSATHV